MIGTLLALLIAILNALSGPVLPATAPSATLPPLPVAHRRSEREPVARPAVSPRPKAAVKKAFGPWVTVDSSAYGIGDGFMGGHMACGGRVDWTSLTVAYRYLHTSRAELHCGDQIVIRLAGSKGPGFTVTVTDAGPFYRNRIFDLAPGACHKLGVCGIPRIEWRKLVIPDKLSPG